MDQRKIDVRLQLKDAPGAGHMFGKKECPRNELVIRLTPNESIFIRANVKAPGLSMAPVQSELDLTYRDRYGDTFKNQPSAYARMILNVRSSSVEFENNANVHSIMSLTSNGTLLSRVLKQNNSHHSEHLLVSLKRKIKALEYSNTNT